MRVGGGEADTSSSGQGLDCGQTGMDQVAEVDLRMDNLRRRMGRAEGEDSKASWISKRGRVAEWLVWSGRVLMCERAERESNSLLL